MRISCLLQQALRQQSPPPPPHQLPPLPPLPEAAVVALSTPPPLEEAAVVALAPRASAGADGDAACAQTGVDTVRTRRAGGQRAEAAVTSRQEEGERGGVLDGAVSAAAVENEGQERAAEDQHAEDEADGQEQEEEGAHECDEGELLLLCSQSLSQRSEGGPSFSRPAAFSTRSRLFRHLPLLACRISLQGRIYGGGW